MTPPPPTRRPLRGQGPTVFISYSYRDAALARALMADLESAGMQVRIEDESSLLGQPLRDVLPGRIGDSEVFVQLLTSSSTVSKWVADEFAWATRPAGDESQRPIILPVVVAGADVPKAVSDWGYLAAAEGLDQPVLDVIRRTAMGAVALLPLDPTAPFQFESRALNELLQSDTLCSRRLLVDPDNLLLRSLDATVAYGQTADTRDREAILHQQERGTSLAERLVKDTDIFLPHALARLRAPATEHWSEQDAPQQIAQIVQALGRLTIGSEILRLAEDWAIAVEQVLGDGMAACEAATLKIGLLETGRSDLSRTIWALGSDYEGDWIELGFDAEPPVEGAHAAMPDAFDDIGRMSIQFGTRPETEILTGDWLRYGVPQVAARALLNLQGRDPAEVAAGIGWRLGDYDRVGFY